jgi:DNA invertase Pin-like site-specific DNA recombinase
VKPSGGYQHAKANPQKYRGRKPTYTREQDAVLDMLTTTSNITEIAAHVGLTRQTVLRIKSDPESAYERVERWN